MIKCFQLADKRTLLVVACGFEQKPFAKIPIKIEIVQVYFFLNGVGVLEIGEFVKSLDAFAHFFYMGVSSVISFGSTQSATGPRPFGEKPVDGHFLRQVTDFSAGGKT